MANSMYVISEDEDPAISTLQMKYHLKALILFLTYA
jgi:hypothetical protein